MKIKNKKSDLKSSYKPMLWQSSMSVEEPNIDRQHQKLMAGINKLHEIESPDKKINKVRESINLAENYILEHFSYEQDYMAKIKFPGLRKHIKLHEKFIQFFNDFKKDLNKTISNKDILVSEAVSALLEKCRIFMADWWKNHMLKEDQKYHHYAKKKKLIGKNWQDKIKSKTRNVSDKNIKSGFNMSNIANEIKQDLIKEQRKSVDYLNKAELKAKTSGTQNYVFTGISGFDDLLTSGIPSGSSLLVAGGAGSGKTIFCLQTLINKAREGKKCLYLSLEEREDKLIEHMEDFGFDVNGLIKKGKLKIARINPFDITRNVDAMLAKQKGELLIDVDPVILPKDFAKPDFIVIDSLTAIASAFTGKEDNYRIYIEQLFRFLEKTGATSFLITETEQIPKIFSQTGVEEFLADGVIVLYAIKHGNVRENALEILKLRGASHQKKIVAMQITEKGMVVYPEQEIFSDI